MGSFAITMLIFLLMSIFSGKSFRKLLSGMQGEVADAQTMDEAEDFDSPFDTDSVEEDYFSYETVQESAPVQNIRKAPAKPVAEEKSSAILVEEQPEPVDFDLRQAVIYQTILQNKYAGIE